MPKLIISDIEINVATINNEDYICLTDMMSAKDGDFFVTDWLRNKNTLEYIGIWEKVYNPNFNYGEFTIIKNQAGLNRFKISVKDFVNRTNAISLYAKAGRYGGTYAHKDIAFEFAMWISPEFNVALFGKTAKMWRDENPDLKGNIRDHASIQQLIVLINLESMNSELIKLGLSQSERAARLNKMAIEQLTTLNKYDNKLLKDINTE